MQRRGFLKQAGAAAALGSMAAPVLAQNKQQVKWRMSTSWPKSLDTIYGSADEMCKRVHELTDVPVHFLVMLAMVSPVIVMTMGQGMQGQGGGGQRQGDQSGGCFHVCAYGLASDAGSLAATANVSIPSGVKGVKSCNEQPKDLIAVNRSCPSSAGRRLLKEKPQVIGLAVPASLLGVRGWRGCLISPYDVLLIGRGARVRCIGIASELGFVLTVPGQTSLLARPWGQ